MSGMLHLDDGHSKADGLLGKVGDVHVASTVDLWTNR